MKSEEELSDLERKIINKLNEVLETQARINHYGVVDQHRTDNIIGQIQALAWIWEIIRYEN